jgi:hypothetical protein
VAFLPLAACSSSSGGLSDGGVYDAFVADAGHDAKHDAAKDAGADTAPKDAEPRDATMDVDHADASDGAPTEAGDHDATLDGDVDAAKDAAKDAANDVEADAAKDADDDVHDAAAPTLESYYFEGRWDTTSLAAYATQPVAEWAGSAVHATFMGTTIGYDVIETASTTATALGGGGFDSLSVVIDNGTPITIALNAGFPGDACMVPGGGCVVGENAAQITTGLAAGKHTIAIYKTTDPFYGGKIQFKQLIPGGPGAAIVKAAYTFPHHIEWIGDDINVGRGDILANAPPGCASDNPQELALNSASNESLSYAALVSAHFQAERHNVSIGSSGIAASLGGNAPLLPDVYSFVLPDESTNPWSFTTWSPDAASPDLVVVNLGSYGDFTNCDTTNCADPDTGGTIAPTGALGASIARAYDSFLATVRMKYAKAFILVVSGNGYGGSIQASDAGNLVNYVVKQRGLAGETLSGAAQTMDFYSDASDVGMGAFQYTCLYYPTSASQATLAAAVEDIIHTDLGW